MKKIIFFFFIIILNVFQTREQNPLSDMEKRILGKKNHEKKNLIIAVITKYHWDLIAIFFNSIKSANIKNCDVVTFVANMTDKTIDNIKSTGVIVLPMPKKYLTESIINSRWKIIMDYLDENPNRYRYIFTCDTRDVFFQDDPFKYYDLKKPYLGIAMEDGTLNDRINKDWLINAYGVEKYNKIKDERIFCVGTVWGTVDKFYEFAKLMWDNLSSEWSKSKHVIEQAVGNYIIYYDKKFSDCLVKSFNDDGYVLTIGMTTNDKLLLNLDFDIFNGQGKKGAVIHQFDRRKELVTRAYMKYYPEYLDNTIYFIIGTLILFIFFVVFLVNNYKNIAQKKYINFEREQFKLIKTKDDDETNNQKLNL